MAGQAVFVTAFHSRDVRTTRREGGSGYLLFWKQRLLISRNRSGEKLRPTPFMAERKTILVTRIPRSRVAVSAKSSR